jgi:hypothetical protein
MGREALVRGTARPWLCITLSSLDGAGSGSVQVRSPGVCLVIGPPA